MGKKEKNLLCCPHSQIVFWLWYIVCNFIPKLVLKDILAQTVQENVHLTVNLTPVDTRTDHVLALQVGWVIIVLQVMVFKMLSNILRKNVLKVKEMC